MKLEIKNVSCGYEKKVVIKDISFTLQTGEIFCLLGPNGVGKTTLFKSILGFLKLHGGEILLNGKDLRRWPPRLLAKALGYVPQAHVPPFPFKVLDVVTMGRTAHMGLFASPTRADIKIAEESLETIGVAHLKERTYTEISGGEKQMILLARALAQEAEILVLDEPTSNLDFGNQMRVLEQIKKLSGKGLGVIMTSHFPNHAFLCSTKVALMCKENMFIVGTAEEVVSEKNLRMAYGIDVKITSTLGHDGMYVKSCVPLLN